MPRNRPIVNGSSPTGAYDRKAYAVEFLFRA
jgi:hypothetical protein